MRDDPLKRALDYEVAGEMATSLGRAGKAVEKAMARLEDEARNSAAEGDRERLLKDAAAAVHAYFIQRELMGMRRHDAVIREYRIPRAVLARLGAS